MTDSYIVKIDDESYINFDVAPKNCNLMIVVRGTKGYQSYFQAADKTYFILREGNWKVADKEEVKKACQCI